MVKVSVKQATAIVKQKQFKNFERPELKYILTGQHKKCGATLTHGDVKQHQLCRKIVRGNELLGAECE
ncbi:hypothetical protein E2986_13807 [Frieseomelitta varia]|uniref:Uncharacterized protein n=1 Tax=Frieseomelitta varia TaxID=561572 RepID=A0A833W1L7_9HYME|nr:hypothetical protein E2986_13807 [Frieseomelitta varia]